MPEKPKIDFSKLQEYSAEPKVDPATLWFLRHTVDGDAYGPFSFEQLVLFATQGRVPKTSELKNEAKTSGAWVPVHRVARVFNAIPTSETASKPHAEPVSAVANDLFSKATVKPKNMPGPSQSTSIIDLFDPSFSRYVTPWVVRVVWAVFLVTWLCAWIFWTFVIFRVGLIGVVNGIRTGDLSVGETVQVTYMTFIFYFLFLCFHLLFLLALRLAFEACVALFDISNTLKQIAKRPQSP